MREFSKSLQGLQARQGTKAVALTQLDKCSWQVQCTAHKPLELSYEVYAFDNSVRTAWLDVSRGFFNGTSLFLRVHGQETAPHLLEILEEPSRPHWQLATSLPPHKTHSNGFGSYLAADYDELVAEMLQAGYSFKPERSCVACGVPHRFVVAGAPASFDGTRLLADTQAICEAEIRFWHGDTTVKGIKNVSA